DIGYTRIRRDKLRIGSKCISNQRERCPQHAHDEHSHHQVAAPHRINRQANEGDQQQDSNNIFHNFFSLFLSSQCRHAACPFFFFPASRAVLSCYMLSTEFQTSSITGIPC